MRRAPAALLGLALLPQLASADELNGLRNSVAPVGDLDGDGVPDFALALRSDAGTPFTMEPERPVREDLGAVLVVSGGSGERLRFLRPPEGGGSAFGRALEDLGDVDGDGLRDLAVADRGRVWVFAGADGVVLHAFGGDGYGPDLGRALAGGGDLDRDGAPDLLVADEERVYAYSGRSGELLRVLGCGAAPEGPAGERYVRLPGRALTSAVGLLPDRGQDGRAAIAVAVRRNDGGACDLLIQGGFELRRIPLPETGESGEPWVVRALPDLDGDDVPEVAMTMIQDYALVYSGATGAELQRHSWLGGYLRAEGSSLEVVGDVDGDGVADYAVGANEDSIDCDSGMAVVFSGKDGRELRSFHPREDSIGGRCGVGVDVCGLGDANGDGVPDLVIHLPRLREARVLSGADLALLRAIDLAPDSAVLAESEGR
jgi:hypothetical protein